MKKFFEGRSKVAIVVFALSIILLCILIPEIIMKSKNIYDYFVGILPFDKEQINGTDLFSAVLVQWGSDITILDILLLGIMFLIALFNITGFIGKKIEFNFISIGLLVMTFCFNIFTFDHIMSMILFLLFILVNIWAYISELKINKSLKK